MTKTLSLFELNSLVADVINTTMSRSYWVEAELSEVRENRGHCYMELIEKNENSNVPIARASAKCWSNIWSAIKPYFIRITGQQIRAGMKVMLQVHAQFHPQYGFSWIVDDINPEYTMGDMMRKRQEIIRQLKEEGVYDLQKELNLPLFAQRIAVISSATAAGYGDFCNQLENNELGLFFHVELFPAIMQGDNVESSIIASLNHINNREEEFDCVVIIRGGGATADLSGFDTLGLAENVANFPLPIITGIGHERDESILDMVSYQRVKTPTAAAAYLINHLTSTLIRVENAQSTIIDYVKKAHEMGLQVWGLVDNLSDEVSTVKLLKKSSVRKLLIEKLINDAIDYELDGINLDFESLNAEGAKYYIQFIRELSVYTRKNKLILSIDDPSYAAYNKFYARGKQAEVADYIINMGYDEHYSGSDKGSVASIDFVKSAIYDTLKEVPREKLINAIPVYTRLWKEENGKLSSQALGIEASLKWVEENNLTPEWKEDIGQNYVELISSGESYYMWLEDEKSLELKLKYMKENDLAGVAVWRLGLEPSYVWSIIKY